MTAEEASRRFHVSKEKLQFYEENGLLEHQTLADGMRDYTEADLRRIGLIHALLKAGLTVETLKAYLRLLESKTNSKEEQVQILRRQRVKLLDEIHKKQQSLDELDYMISEIKKT